MGQKLWKRKILSALHTTKTSVHVHAGKRESWEHWLLHYILSRHIVLFSLDTSLKHHRSAYQFRKRTEKSWLNGLWRSQTMAYWHCISCFKFFLKSNLDKSYPCHHRPFYNSFLCLSHNTNLIHTRHPLTYFIITFPFRYSSTSTWVQFH